MVTTNRRRIERQHSCIYCGNIANTRDHVPPRSLLERPFPLNLNTVPSCDICNNGSSSDEQYFLMLVSQVSLSKSMVAKVEAGGIVDRTLMRAPALEERLLQSLETDEETGRVLIRPETDRVTRVLKKIALGLFLVRYNRIPLLDQIGPATAYPYQIDDLRPLPYFVSTFSERFRSKLWQVVQAGIFEYIFVRDPMHSSNIWCVMDFHRSLWGVVHMPNPRSTKVTANRQLWLLPDDS